MSFTERTACLLGEAAIAKLAASHVLVVGIGGVGSFAAEALCRAGVGELTLVDSDVVTESNLNRQLFALRSTVGRPKTEAAAERLRDIAPEMRLHLFQTVYGPETRGEIFARRPDYVLDCIDSVSAKADLIRTARELGIPLLSAMGTGNKTDPTRLRVTTLDKTAGCPLARVMRNRLRGTGCEKTPVVTSDEPPAKVSAPEGESRVPASCAWVPSSAGLLMAGTCVMDLIREDKTEGSMHP